MVSPGEEGFWQKGVDEGVFDPEKMANPWQYGSKMAPFDEEVSINKRLTILHIRMFSLVTVLLHFKCCRWWYERLLS